MTVGTAQPIRTRAAHLGPERRRPQVLDAALAIAMERGVTAVTVTSVAERMDVTKPVVYACFSSREELIDALLEREQQVLLSGVLSALPAQPSFSDHEALLIEGFQALLHVVSEHPGSWRIVFAPSPDPDVAERFARARALVVERVGAVMRPILVERGAEDVDHKLPVLVEAFMGAGESAVRSLIQGDGSWTPDELGEFVGRMVFRALRGA